MKRMLLVSVLALCCVAPSAQTQSPSREEVFARVSEGLKQVASGTVTHQTGPLVRDTVEYARFENCRFSYRRTAELLAPTLVPARDGKGAGHAVVRRAEFEIEEWRFSLADIDAQSVAVVKPWTGRPGQRLYIEFATAGGGKLIERKDQREPWRRERGEVARGRLTIHDDQAAGAKVAAELRRAIELCRE